MLGTPVAKAKKKASSGEETKARIIGATLATLKEEGIVGTSARAIARAGDFNQALIFYHFGSIDELVVAAVGDMSRRRMERHRERLEEAEKFSDLIRIARNLNFEDRESKEMTVLVQAFAGASANTEMGSQLFDELEPWSDMVGESIRRTLKDSPLATALPHDRVAQAISALFLGIELIDNLDPTRAYADDLFDTLEPLAVLLEGLVNSPLLDGLQPKGK